MIERSLAGMREVCERIIVVGGFAFEQLQAMLLHVPQVECVENPAYRQGMFTSVKAGLSRVRGTMVFLLPVDTPLVPPGVYRALAAINAPITVPTFQGARGHPVCILASEIPAILIEPDGSSLREFIHRRGFTAMPVETGSVLLDIDTPEDHNRVTRLLRGTL
jgi:molybdenum cofactor cytidylyltransferase